MSRPKYIVMDFDTSYTDFFWKVGENGYIATGDYSCIYFDDEKIDISLVSGLKEWVKEGDKYDPYSDIADFTLDGREEWIAKGFVLSKQVLQILPKDVELVYAFWHNFGGDNWKKCTIQVERYDRHYEPIKYEYPRIYMSKEWSELFWDGHCSIGDYCLQLDWNHKSYDLRGIEGLEEWFWEGDEKYDPCMYDEEDAAYTAPGREEWTNKGCELAIKVRQVLPKDLEFYYGFYYQFEKDLWLECYAYIP